jgi:DHA1 family tetracycline resistance protein-like MFS transporter
MNKQKIIILATVFVDVLGFGIVIPILPYYLLEFGASPTLITLLFAIFSFCAFLSSPFLGALSDRIGRRPVILLSIFSTAIGWFIFASANSVIFLFLGRIIDGLAAGNFTTAQSYLVDISKNEKDRMSNLGIIGATFGVGFVLGPLIGGLLSTVSHSFPFFIAGIMALINGISALFFLKESNIQRNQSKLRYNPLLPLISAYKKTELRPLFFVWFLFSISFVMVNSVFALFSKKVFGYDSFQTGLVFTIIGIVIIINQVFLLKKFWLHRFTQDQIQITMLLLVSIGLLLIASENKFLFFASLPFLGTSQAVLRVIITNKAVNNIDSRMKGEIMGIIASIMTGAMVITPMFAGMLFESSSSLPFLTASFFSLLALAISKKFAKL